MDISERTQLEVNPLSHVLERWLRKMFIIYNCIQRTICPEINIRILLKGPAWKENYLFGGLNSRNQRKSNNIWVKKYTVYNSKMLEKWILWKRFISPYQLVLINYSLLVTVKNQDFHCNSYFPTHIKIWQQYACLKLSFSVFFFPQPSKHRYRFLNIKKPFMEVIRYR